MRDGMPGPGWWLASDGRWYPPSLHPDMRAWAKVAVDEAKPAVPAPPVGGTMPTSSLGVLHDVPNANGADLAQARSSNGTSVATTARDTIRRAPTPLRTTRPTPPRTPQHRLAVGLMLGVGTLLAIVYLTKGHDVRPSLSAGVATTAVSGTAAPSPTTLAATSAQRTAGSSTTAAAAVATTLPATASTGTASGTTTRPAATPTTAPAKVTPHVVSVFDLVKGNCLDSASLTDGLVTTIRVVDCSEVHTHEVYYSARYPDSTFDATKISNYANDTCLAQFAPYVGIDYEKSRYQYLHIVPTQESWTRDNDRDIVCVAFEEDATITGSIAGRAQ